MAEKLRVLHLGLADPRINQDNDLRIINRLVESNGGRIINPNTLDSQQTIQMISDNRQFARLLRKTTADLKKADCGIALIPTNSTGILTDRITANLATMLHPLFPKPCLLISPEDDRTRIPFAELLQNDYLLKVRSSDPTDISDALKMLITLTGDLKQAEAFRPVERSMLFDSTVIVNGDISLDIRRRIVFVNGQQLKATDSEFVLLGELLENRGSYVSDEVLIESAKTKLLKDYSKEALRAAFYRLGVKIGNLGSTNNILNVQGGYIVPLQSGISHYDRDELIARRQATRNSKESSNVSPIFVNGPLRVDCNKRIVQIFDQEIVLISSELKVLTYLISRIGQIATKEALTAWVWGEGSTAQDHGGALRQFVSQLRKKLPLPKEVIETIKPIGYKMRILDKNGTLVENLPS